METDARSPAGRLLTLESLDYSRHGCVAQTLDGKAYDFGAAADYNTDLLKRKINESSELALPASLNTTLLSTSYAVTLVPEAQAYMPVGFDSGDWNEIFPAEPNVEVSMAGFIEAGNISKQFPPTPFVNDEEIPGQIATAPLFSPSPQKLSGTTDGSHEVPLKGLEGRLSCDHPGCNKTFPRRYEKSAPFDIPGLSDHLTKRHHMDYDAQPNLDFIRYTVLGSRSVPFWFYRLCLNGRDTCPLAPIGCTYRVTADDNEYQSKRMMRQHILTHELSDRR
ncbi:hypothetical protein BCON_0281g00070 [Botryotinia convoluta]|uniref:Uncharacterized protein n=1 Tax=Botryotinia convoluta TaxID=54673 RepID=A0A4Z1HJD9_9HELO|nr:hypothetical protein BCON_0281g00070 [Botryotinia convoluta]